MKNFFILLQFIHLNELILNKIKSSVFSCTSHYSFKSLIAPCGQQVMVLDISGLEVSAQSLWTLAFTCLVPLNTLATHLSLLYFSYSWSRKEKAISEFFLTTICVSQLLGEMARKVEFHGSICCSGQTSCLEHSSLRVEVGTLVVQASSMITGNPIV